MAPVAICPSNLDHTSSNAAAPPTTQFRSIIHQTNCVSYSDSASGGSYSIESTLLENTPAFIALLYHVYITTPPGQFAPFVDRDMVVMIRSTRIMEQWLQFDTAQGPIIRPYPGMK